MTSSAALPKHTIPSDADESQRRAADPQRSVWVGASAGSGKTKVLTDRVLRLLLPRENGDPGTAPHRILCLTFTKSAAGEMALRLSARLSQWAVMEEPKLAAELSKLTGRTPDANDTAAARRLFAAVTDAPGGLNIMTIHAFCQSVLGRFPLEARLPPYFEPLEESEAQDLLTRARAQMMAQARREPGSPLGMALRQVAAMTAEDGAGRLIADMIGESAQFHALLAQHGGMDGLLGAVCETLGLSSGDTDESVLRAACVTHIYDERGLRAACRAMAEHGTSSTDHPAAAAVQAWLDAPAEKRPTLWDTYKAAFLTAAGEPRKKLFTKGPGDAFPDIAHIMSAEQSRVIDTEDKRKAARCAMLTGALLRLGAAILSRYDVLKAARGGLDFDDLINRTLELLERREMSGWVMFKLDGGLDHILVDEAQDTNPEQWRIIAALCDDFFSGAGARGGDIRTIFAVGDEKQSIYSFQRAAPEKFRDMRAFFSERIEAARQRLAQENMNVSFRSVPAVLDAVDATFAPDAVREGLGPLPLKHESHRGRAHGHGGVVEVWPLFTTPDREDRDPWEPPVTVRAAQGGGARLAEHIGDTIKGWLNRGERIESRGRPVQPGDIMILLRRRSAFAGQLIRALKTRAIPVGGADRMVLKDQLAVQDLVAAAQFALLPSDDFSLACLLKSPLIGWDDGRLEAVAAGRAGTLWEALKVANSDIVPYLASLIETARRDSRPYEFFSAILQRPCPADPVSGLRAITARMGAEALDPLEEFASAALAFEADNMPSLQTFLLRFAQGGTEVKRAQEEAGGRVRIMTVHGAKGLQAPIVFLPDTVRTTRTPPGSTDQRLIWPDKSGLAAPLWSPRKDSDCRLYAGTLAALERRMDEEYRRLLYVAMTRAEDRLYICGHTGRKAPLPDNWHAYAAAGLKALKAVTQEPFPAAGAEAFRLCLRDPATLRVQPEAAPAMQVPTTGGDWGWLRVAARAERPASRPLSPSRTPVEDGAVETILSPRAGGDTFRFLRGNITHKLLQHLPGTVPENRERAAADYVARHGEALPPTVRAEIVQETLAVLAHPDFAPLFGPGSMAEVPVTGLAGGVHISGQIDRLLVTETEVWIADYKTNRPSPPDETAIPEAYRAQMKYYSDIVANIYAGRRVRCFLLWTDTLRLMEVQAG